MISFVIHTIDGKMDPCDSRRHESVVSNASRRRDDILQILVTDGSTDIALALIYRIFADNVFGDTQAIFVTLFEFKYKAIFLDSVIIEISSCSPNNLHGMTYSSDASVAFKDADVIFCIGSAREYTFFEEDYEDMFFREHVISAKFYGESIEAYSKRDVKIVVIGNTAATVIAAYIKSVPMKNITSLTMFNLKMAATHIATKTQCHPSQVKNIIIWGTNNLYVFPDCRFMFFTNGKQITDSLTIWLKDSLPRIMRTITNRPNYIRSMAYGLADHCKILWNGTPENEWTCMGVMSDHSYGTRSGIFFAYPVICQNREYEIVKGIHNDQYIQKYILDLSRLIARDVNAAFKICDIERH